MDGLRLLEKQQVKAEFSVNSTFIFILKDSTSNVILLMGKIQDPSVIEIEKDPSREEL